MHNDTVTKITAATITGLSFSMAEVETGLRIVSLLIGITLSILAYRQNRKNREK